MNSRALWPRRSPFAIVNRTAKRSYASSSFSLGPTIKDLLLQGKANDSVTVSGWIKTLRRQKRVAFAQISDGSSASAIQVVLKPDQVQGLEYGASVEVTGKVSKSLGAEQAIELQAESIKILGQCDETYPLQKKEQSHEFLRQFYHLRSRTDQNAALMRLRGNAMQAIYGFFKKHDFLQVTTPLLTSIDCEGAGEVFQPTYLTVSGQLHAEALASSHSRVYTFSPTFRAEPSITARHLSEFWMLEAEVTFINDLDTLLDLAEAMVREIVSTVANSSKDELGILGNKAQGYIAKLIGAPFARIAYTDAVKVLRDSGVSFQYPPSWGNPLQSEHEKWLSTEHFGKPVFVTKYPKNIKPFYMRIDSQGDTVACFDLLLPRVGELIGGSLREERLKELQQSMREKNLDKADYQWYLDLRRFGTAPHGGFGMGFDRLMLYLTGAENVREVTPFPRWIAHCDL